jgi:hypothetical protein
MFHTMLFLCGRIEIELSAAVQHRTTPLEKVIGVDRDEVLVLASALYYMYLRSQVFLDRAER